MTIPFFSFKTSTIFLDDSDDFLDSIKLCLSDQIDIQVTSQSQEFLERVHYSADLFKKAVLEGENESDQDLMVSVNLNHLCTCIFDLALKKPISVAYVDFSMPSENGLEVIRKIKNTFLKKVLLTGEFNDKCAIDSLNSKAIDAYINKNDVDIENSICAIYKFLSAEYLSELNKMVAGLFLFKKDIQNVYESKPVNEIYKKYRTDDAFVASCIYDQFGSQVIRLKNKDVLLNVYSVDEIKNVLPTMTGNDRFNSIFMSDEFLLDYKKAGSLEVPDFNAWGDFITQDFYKVCDGHFYVSLSELDHRLSF